MDLLTVLEPQLAIPVVGAVVCGVLVYMFGFQQTQEPSFEHLAVLHNRPKREAVSNSTSSKQQQRAPTSPQVKSGKSKEKASTPASPKEKATTRSTKAKAQESPKKEKAAAVSNGAVKTGKGSKAKAAEAPKESPKKKGKASAAPASDDLGGDWTAVPSRKTKSGRSRKE